MRYTFAAAAIIGAVMAMPGKHAEEPKPTSSAAHTTEAPKPTSKAYTTSTVYTTEVYTITSCPPEVHECPESATEVVTKTIPYYTTVCPVGETPTPHAPVCPGAPECVYPTTYTHEAPATTETPKAPETHASSTTVYVHPTPESSVPVSPESPETDSYVCPEATTIVSTVTVYPSASETPKAPETPVSPESPETPEVPVSPETPEVPVSPEAPEVHYPSAIGTAVYPSGTGSAAYPQNTSAIVSPVSPAEFEGAASSVTGSIFVAGVAAVAALILA
ncbi:MAG: hypothetical protein M1833_000594 [Piccolia ochrophora]|nr:MAG: hypothetical protein M1833_000594 [Piccolia ochrophora]